MTIAELIQNKEISKNGKIQQSLAHIEKNGKWKDDTHIYIAFRDNSYIAIYRFNH